MGKKRQHARLFVRQSGFQHPKNSLEEFLQRHPFNSKLQILAPGDVLDEIVGQAVFYICRFELGALMEETFLETWMWDPKMEFCGVSVGGHSDCTDVACIVNRTLRLSLTPESYRSIGLTGRKSRQTEDRYIVDLKLDSLHFKPEHRHYNRVKNFQLYISAEFVSQGENVPKEMSDGDGDVGSGIERRASR